MNEVDILIERSIARNGIRVDVGPRMGAEEMKTALRKVDELIQLSAKVVNISDLNIKRIDAAITGLKELVQKVEQIP